jgi:hypothetical protein
VQHTNVKSKLVVVNLGRLEVEIGKIRIERGNDCLLCELVSNNLTLLSDESRRTYAVVFVRAASPVDAVAEVIGGS